jgi:hypothetical protein
MIKYRGKISLHSGKGKTVTGALIWDNEEDAQKCRELIAKAETKGVARIFFEEFVEPKAMGEGK